MSSQEKKWRKIFMGIMIFIYAVYTPVTVYEWLSGTDGFPLTAVVIGLGLPLIRKNHLKSIREKEDKKPV